jgi:hypothetical protein
MKISLEKNDIMQLLGKINPLLEIEDWTEEGIIVKSAIEGFKGKFNVNLKFDNLSQKADVDIKIKDIQFK